MAIKRAKPRLGAHIDWAAPLARGLVGAWLLNENGGKSCRDLVSGQTLTNLQSTAILWRGNPFFRFNGGFVEGTGPDITSGPFTVAFQTSQLEYNGSRNCLTMGSVGGGDQLLHFRASSSTAFRFSLFSDDLDVTVRSLDGRTVAWCATMDSLKGQRLYEDGELRGSRTSGGFYAGNRTLSFGGGNGSSYDVEIHYVYIYKRGLSAVEAASLAADPYQIVRSPLRLIAFGSGTPPVTSTGDLTSQPFALEGIAQHGDTITSTGDLTSQPTSLAGTGQAGDDVTSTGTLDSQPTSLDATGTVALTGTGDLTSQPSALAGTGAVGNPVTSTGALISEPSTLTGTGLVGVTGTGALTGESSELEGTLFSPVPIDVVASALTAEPPELSGTVAVTVAAVPSRPYNWPWLKITLDGVDISQLVHVSSVSTNNTAGGRSSASLDMFDTAEAPILDSVEYPDVWTDTFTVMQGADGSNPIGEALWFTTFYVGGLPTVRVNGVAQIVAELADIGSTPGYTFYYIAHSPGISHNQNVDPLEVGDLLEFTYPVELPAFGLPASPRYGAAKRVEIIHYPTGFVEFAGVVDSSTSELSNGTHGFTTTQLSCAGYGNLLDRRRVAGVYLATEYGTVESIVREFVDLFFGDLGITYDDHAVSPNEVQTLIFNTDKGGDAMRKLCDAAGCDFYVSKNLEIKLVSGEGVGTGPAPFSISTGDGNFQRLVRTDVNARFWNRVYVRTSRNINPVRKDTIAADGSVSYTLTAPLSELVDGGVIVTIDGVETTDFTIARQGITFTGTIPLAGETIVISSVPDIDAVAMAEDESSINAVGLVEHVREVRDVPDQDSLQGFADAILADGLDTAPDVTIYTDRPGMEPGQAVEIDANGVDETLLVQSVEMSDSENGYPRWTVQMSGRPKRRPLTQAEGLSRMMTNSKTGVDRVTMEIRAKIAETIPGLTNEGVTFAIGLEQGAYGVAIKKGLARRAVIGFRQGTGCTINVLKNGVSIFQAGGITWAGTGPVFTSLFNGDPLVIDIGDEFTLEVVSEDATARDGYISLEYM